MKKTYRIEVPVSIELEFDNEVEAVAWAYAHTVWDIVEEGKPAAYMRLWEGGMCRVIDKTS